MTFPSALTGTIVFWNADDGWGVIESPECPGGCWAHFSVLKGEVGYLALDSGRTVQFEAEAADQDGYVWRALWVRAR